MATKAGKNYPITFFRQLVTDLMVYCQKVPCVTVDRIMNLGKLVAARQLRAVRPSWSAIFLKAMGVVAMRRPELRRTYMSFPWPHLYEHPANVANFPVERNFQGEDIVFFAQIRSPERRSLNVLDRFMRHLQDDPVEDIKFFRRALRLAKVPWPIRKLVWWVSLNLMGKLRSHNFGTFGMTTVGAHGAGLLHFPPLLTATLHYGMIDAKGNLDMRLTFDHRVLDAACAARALVDMENVLSTDILQELTGLPLARAA